MATTLETCTVELAGRAVGAVGWTAGTRPLKPRMVGPAAPPRYFVDVVDAGASWCRTRERQETLFESWGRISRPWPC